jgi:hypothetical protein
MRLSIPPILNINGRKSVRNDLIEMNALDYRYFDWLISQIKLPSNQKTYNELFSRMYDLEFVWTVPNDGNRVQDGLDLRPEFLNGARQRLSLGGVSILEVLIALSRRLAFNAGGDPETWAWRLIKNLRLNKMADPLTDGQSVRVEEALEALVWRTYQPDGQGGFFPLRYPTMDQTKVEVWYQMHAFINEEDQRRSPPH